MIKWQFKYTSLYAAAKMLQSCPTLCDPIAGSPPGSPVPGILQARTLEWVAISFSNAWKWKGKVKSLSRVWLLAIPWTAAYQAPPSMGFSRQEYWSGVPLPSPKDLSVIPEILKLLRRKQAIYSFTLVLAFFFFFLDLSSQRRKVKWKLLSCVRLFVTHGPCSPRNSPGQNTGVGSLSLLQGIFPTQGSNPSLPHSRQFLYQLSHKPNPK